MSNKCIFMETTKISVSKTVSEIQCVLGEAGCSGVMTMFDENKEVSAVCFQIIMLDRVIAFKLPCKWTSIYIHLKGKIKKWPVRDVESVNKKIKEIEDQEKRVAWRQIYRWVLAQISLIDTEMVKVHEVFLPYVQVNIEGQTLFESLEQSKFKALEYKG